MRTRGTCVTGAVCGLSGTVSLEQYKLLWKGVPWRTKGPGIRERTRDFHGMKIIDYVSWCPDCEEPWPHHYMVKPELWAKYGTGKGVLCVRCLQKRMGRQLTPDDLLDVRLNEVAMYATGRRNF